MLFSTTIFLFVFLPLVLAVYYNPIIRSRQFRNVFLLLASIFFYAWGEPFYVLLMLLSIVVNWGLGLLVDRFRNRPGEKAVLLVTVVYNLGVLFLFKYLNFTVNNLNLLFRSDIGNYLMLDRAAILHGQIWRLITFVFIPQGTVGSSISLVLTLLQIYFLYFAGKALENAWGQFKMTVFTLAGMLGCILACLLLPGASVLSQLYGMIAMSAFQSAFVFAFACVYPEAPLLFMFVIPLPAKYLGILEALLMGRDVISVGRTVLSFSRLFGVGALVAGAMLLVSLLLGLLGFWLFAVPVLWNNYKARQRRNQWKNQWK